MKDILERLQTVWPADYPFQPNTLSERICVIEIQQLKLDAIDEITRLRAFSKRVMECWPNGDVDGGDLQDTAEQFGLLTPEMRDAPCGEGCACAENADFPQKCYRKIGWLL